MAVITHPASKSTMFWWRALGAAICGALFSAALPAIGLWPLGLALAPLFVLVANSERPRGAFGLGFFFALVFFGLYLLWLPESFADPNLFGPASWIIYPPLILALGCFWGVVTWLSRWLGGRGALTLWFLPILWVLMEWVRTQGVLAFPWGFLGYLWLPTPLAQLADLAGVYGLSLLTAVLAALLAAPFVIRNPRPLLFSYRRAAFLWQPLVLAALLICAGLGYGLWRLGQSVPPADLQALLVQGDTDPLERALGASSDLDIYTRLTRGALARIGRSPELVIWPEGAVLGNGLEGPQYAPIRDQIQESAGTSTVITGGSAYVGGNSYNSAYSLVRAQVLGRYDKVYLVPFGESFPFIKQLPGLYTIIFGWFGLPLLDSRSPGDSIIPLPTPIGEVATYICYESVFPQVARTMVSKGARLLVNITNDAWFAHGRGMAQHFDMGKLRAIETRRYLLRVGNDGITAAINPLGQVTERLSRFTRGTLLVNFGLSDTRTPYVRYGDILMIVLAGFTLALVAVRLLRRTLL